MDRMRLLMNTSYPVVHVHSVDTLPWCETHSANCLTATAKPALLFRYRG